MTEKARQALIDPNVPAETKAVLKWQFRQYGSFYKALWEAIIRADDDNLDRLEKGFPVEVGGYRKWAFGTLGKELREAGVMD